MCMGHKWVAKGNHLALFRMTLLRLNHLFFFGKGSHLKMILFLLGESYFNLYIHNPVESTFFVVHDIQRNILTHLLKAP